MVISILTLFPEMFASPFSYSIIKRAREKKLIDLRFINIRDFAQDKYKTVDDRPYGGGLGMILKVDVVGRALEYTKQSVSSSNTKSVLLDPKSRIFNQKIARDYSQLDHLILIAGHYEGVDARVSQIVDDSISIGEYVLTGGELPAMVVTDCVTRLIPGVLSKGDAVKMESFTDDKVESPQYTRPSVYKKMRVPQVLLSGHHQDISEWRISEALKASIKRKPPSRRK